jgi:hypothetical protein
MQAREEIGGHKKVSCNCTLTIVYAGSWCKNNSITAFSIYYNAPYEPEHVIPFVGSITEERPCIIIFESATCV